MPLPFSRRALQTAPSFSRDFAGLKTLDHGVGPAIKFERASNATFFDANGTLQTASNDTPRFDHSGGSSLGLLIEEARTNLFERSAELDNAYWNKTRATVTANDQVSPDGGTNAEKVTANATNASGSHVNKAVTITSAATISVSAFFKKGSDDHALILVGDAGANAARQWFNLDTGAVASSNTAGTGWAKSSATITSVGNGWYRCVFVATTTGTTAQGVFYPAVSADLGFSATDVSTFGYIWGAQLEQGAFPTSYIPTTTAAATRAADSAVVTPISSFYNQAEGTLFAEYSRPQVVKYSSFLHIDDATGNEQITLESGVADPTIQRFQVRDGNVAQVQIGNYSSSTANTVYRMSGAYAVDNFAVSQNGASAVTDVSGTLPTVNRMMFSVTPSATYIRKLAYYPRRLSNTLLQQLTT
jgi:hypothetical protein